MEKFIINGGKKLHGEISVNGSKNATVAILAAVLLNKGKTTLKNVPQIEEVNRWLEVLESLGVKIAREDDQIVLAPPANIDLKKIDKAAAKWESEQSNRIFLCWKTSA